jgi:alkylation response protein AidB-like acyl-CoA dehydrogenase
VDFDLSDDQVALRDAARRLLDDLAAPARVRAVVDAGGAYDRALWSAVVEQGWMGVALAEEHGGLGLGTVELAILLEEVGSHAAPIPFLESVLALHALARAGLAEWVERLLAGEAIGCVQWDPRAPVIYAPSAGVVVARHGDGLVVAPNPKSAAEPAMDRTRELGWLEVDGTTTEPAGTPDDVDDLLDLGAMGYSAQLLGGASRLLDMAVEYAKDRVQFGRPIGSFQAVKHRLADALVDVEGMRSSVYYAAWCIGAGDPDAKVAASTAKTWCSDAGRRVAASALQVHGGIGFTWEHDLHLYLKRAHLDGLTFGDAAFHRDRLARLLRPRVEAGDSVV